MNALCERMNALCERMNALLASGYAVERIDTLWGHTHDVHVARRCQRDHDAHVAMTLVSVLIRWKSAPSERIDTLNERIDTLVSVLIR